MSVPCRYHVGAAAVQFCGGATREAVLSRAVVGCTAFRVHPHAMLHGSTCTTVQWTGANGGGMHVRVVQAVQALRGQSHGAEI